MEQSPRHCLVVGPSWVGDMVMAQSLFMVLRERFPNMKIDVLAPAWSAPLLASMPEVDGTVVMPLGHGKLDLGARYRLGKSLREKQYDWSICLPNSFKSALVPMWAKIPKRTGFKGEQRYGLLNDMRKLDKRLLPMTVQRFVALGLPGSGAGIDDYPFPRLELSPAVRDDLTGRLGLQPDRPLLALCPGAEYGPAKRWPESNYAAVATAMIADGWKVAILGSGKDREVASEIAGLVDREACLNLAGETELIEAITLLGMATAVVTNDSGLMHVAAAVETPLVAIYGSSDPGFTPPLSDSAEIVSLGLDCSPCFKRECPLGHLDCLNGITPDRVLSILRERHSGRS